MRSNSITVEPSAFAQWIGRLLFVLGLRKSRLTLYKSTEDILNHLRKVAGTVTAKRASGKTTALLIFARELMGRFHTEKVGILVPWHEGPHFLATAWRKYFPFERSPLFTSDPKELEGFHYFLIDEPQYLSMSTKEALHRLMSSNERPYFAGEVMS